MKKILLVLSFIFFIAGCTHLPFLYRADIQQGNILTAEKVSQIKPGMPSDQVRYLIGSPVLMNTLDANRWDYVYTYQPGGGEMQVKRVTIHFVNDAVNRISEG